MDQGSDVKFMQISRFIFTAPSWKRSLFLIIILGLLIDGAGVPSMGDFTIFSTAILWHACFHYPGHSCTCPYKANHRV